MEPNERFDLAENIAERLTTIAKDFRTVGVYGPEEYKYLTSLVLSCGLAMKILDPDRYTVYLDRVQKEYEDESAKTQKVAEGATGPYL